MWWFENGDLVLSNEPDVVIAVLDGKATGAVDDPRRHGDVQGGATPFSRLPWALLI